MPRTGRRCLLALSAVLVIMLAVLAITASRNTAVHSDPWFAGYVDVTVSPAHPFETPTSNATKNVILSFIVTGAANPCEPRWGPDYTLEDASTLLNLDDRLATLRKNGGHAAISFGGANNTELSNTCTDPPSLQEAYTAVVDRYGVSTVDFDIEGENLTNPEATTRRAMAIASVQDAQEGNGKHLDVWLTLPASPRGLTDDGVAEVEAMLSAGVDLAGLNIMTMSYGNSRRPGQSMLAASEASANAVHSQLGIIYQRAGQELDSPAVWAKIGLTPMIGLNDVPTDVFDLETARQFAQFAVENKVARMSMWSYNRDRECQPGNLDLTAASHICSGIVQPVGAFTQVLGPFFSGRFR